MFFVYFVWFCSVELKLYWIMFHYCMHEQAFLIWIPLTMENVTLFVDNLNHLVTTNMLQSADIFAC